MQASNDEELKAVFTDEDMLGILLETGFRIPVTSLSIQDKEAVVSTLKDYYLITRVRKFAFMSNCLSQAIISGEGRDRSIF